MSSLTTITAIESFCTNSTGIPNQWYGNTGQYQWNLGRPSKDGNINGVVRKLAGTAYGVAIWVVAGSLKIEPTGNIIRFTGMARKYQTLFSNITQHAIPVANVLTV